MQTLKAIIFDVDGTLANTEETHRQAFNCAFQEFKLDYYWSEQEYAQLLAISGGRERILAYLKEHNHEVQGDMSLRDFALHIHQRKSEIYREKLIAGHIGLRVGVSRLINEARQQNIKLGIATATSEENVKTLLKNTLGKDAFSLFDAVVTSDIVKDKKPSPVVYQFALAELGISPENCIAIEDTTNGNRAALAAGIKTIITTHVFTRDSDFSGASLVLDQLGEPDKPFKVNRGNVFDSRFVNIKLIRQLLKSGKVIDQAGETWSDLGVVVLAK